MSVPDPSPFSEPKGRRWVWIVPSVLLHLVILVIWLLLPEPEPRQPGERKLTIKEEQAEELQEHVEEANLKKLREKISELQAIKAAMANIREEEMARVSDFEQSMVGEAPQDIAALLGELAAVYDSVHENYETVEEAVDFYAEKAPQVQQAAGKDTIDGLRALPGLKGYWERFEGMADRFEVAFYETEATLKAIEVKLEWVDDPGLIKKIEALKEPMEATEAMHHEAWGAVPASWKQKSSFDMLVGDLEEKIDTVRRFRQSETEGQAEVAKKRGDLEERIARAEADLARTNEAYQAAEAALEAMDKNKDGQAWSAQRESVRKQDRARKELQNELRNLNRELTRTSYKPDGKLAREVQRIESRLQHALPPVPDRGVIDRAMAQQQEMVRKIEALAESLKEVPQ